MLRIGQFKWVDYSVGMQTTATVGKPAFGSGLHQDLYFGRTKHKSEKAHRQHGGPHPWERMKTLKAHAPAKPKPSANTMGLAVGTYNIEDYDQNTPLWRQIKIAELLRRPLGHGGAADLWLLQEMDSEEDARHFMENTGLNKEYPHLVYVPPREDWHAGPRHGLVMISRQGITMQSLNTLVKPGLPRPVAEMKLLLENGKEITVFNLHLKATSFRERGNPALEAYSRGKRLEQVQMIRDRVNDILESQPDAEIVVAGDFNAPNFGEAMTLSRILAEADLIPAEPVKSRSNHKGGGTMSRIFIRRPIPWMPKEEGGVLQGSFKISHHLPTWIRLFLPKPAQRQPAAA